MFPRHVRTTALVASLSGCIGIASSACGPAEPEAEVLNREAAALSFPLEDDTLIELPRPRIVLVGAVLDTDGDGLLNVIESFGCTDPLNADTDGDGIPDGWERNGNGVFDYPAEGADPCHKDVFVEVDYEERVVGGITQSARMGADLEAALVTYYAGLPIANPNGVNGITLHLYPSDVLAAGFNCAVQESPFSYDQDAFHKLELCLSNNGASVGAGAIPGQRFRITAPPVNQDPLDDQTERAQYTWYWMFLHELGHNLGLMHGGNVNTNRKPHYPSVMNYLYDVSLNGSLARLNASGVGYTTSREFLAELDECALRERSTFLLANQADLSFMTFAPANWVTAPGGAAGPWVDWNRNGVFDVGLVNADVNADGNITCGSAFADTNDIERLATQMGNGLPCKP